MRITRANLAVAGAASTNKKEPDLNRVHLSPDGSTVASNGSMLLAVGPPDPKKTEGFPDVDHPEPPIPESGVGISISTVADIKRNLPTDKRMALQQAKITRCDSKVEILTTDGVKDKKVATAPMRGTFPKWRKLVADAHRDADITSVVVNRRELMKMLKAIDEACPDRGEFAPVRLEIGKPGALLVLRSRNYETEQRVVGFVKPILVKGKWHAETKWERELFAEGSGETQECKGMRVTRRKKGVGS